MKVFVVLHGHSEYQGFSVFGGVYADLESAIKTTIAQLSYTQYLSETCEYHTKKGIVKMTYVVPFDETSEQERRDDLNNYGIDNTAYHFGFIVQEQEV